MYLKDNFYLWRRAEGGGVGGAEGSQLLLDTEKKYYHDLYRIWLNNRYSDQVLCIYFQNKIVSHGQAKCCKGFYLLPSREIYIFISIWSFFPVSSVQTRNIEWNICVCGSIKSGADIRRRRRSWQSDEVIFWLLLKKLKKQSPDASWTFPVRGKGFSFSGFAPAQITHCTLRWNYGCYTIDSIIGGMAAHIPADRLKITPYVTH